MSKLNSLDMGDSGSICFAVKKHVVRICQAMYGMVSMRKKHSRTCLHGVWGCMLP